MLFVHLLGCSAEISSTFSIAVRSIQQTEASILAQDPDTDHEVSLMESLLMTEGLTKKDVVTLILDMLFAGIDTVMEFVKVSEVRAKRNVRGMIINKS